MNSCIWDYRDPYEWMARVAKSAMPPAMISVAITGGIQGKEYNPNIPESAEEQIEAACAAYQEGAVSVHIHARNPNNLSQQTDDKNVYSKINEEIRKRCPGMIINNSTGGSPELSIQQKLAGVFADCKPDMASLNPGPFMMNMHLKERKAPLSGPRPEWSGDVNIPVSYSDVYLAAKTMLEHDIKPEIEVFHPGHYHVIKDLIDKGLIKAPYVTQLVFGFQTSIYPTPWNVLNMINELPKDSIFFCPGIGPYQLPINMMALVMGGHVRVGLEDNVYYKKGELAKSSAQFVARIRRISEEMNRPIATPTQAREMLCLPEVE